MKNKLLKSNTVDYMRAFLFILATLFLYGCASVEILSVSENESLKPTRTMSSITISPYMTIKKHPNPSLNTLYLDQGTGFIYEGRIKDNPPVPNKLGYTIAQSTKLYLNKNTSFKANIDYNPSRSDLWIKGQLLKEKEGSRALRVIIGLGAGKTHMETKTYIYNMASSDKNPWLTIHTLGGSGKEPGAIFSAMPSPILAFNILGAIGASTTLITQSNKGLSQDAKRSGKVIGKELNSRLKSLIK